MPFLLYLTENLGFSLGWILWWELQFSFPVFWRTLKILFSFSGQLNYPTKNDICKLSCKDLLRILSTYLFKYCNSYKFCSITKEKWGIEVFTQNCEFLGTSFQPAMNLQDGLHYTQESSVCSVLPLKHAIIPMWLFWD